MWVTQDLAEELRRHERCDVGTETVDLTFSDGGTNSASTAESGWPFHAVSVLACLGSRAATNQTTVSSSKTVFAVGSR